MVSPDAGGVERARAFSKRLGAGLAIIDKRRPAPNVSEVMNIVGDVRGKKAVIVDDIIDTAGTLTNAANAVMDAGAASVLAVRDPRGVLGQGGPAHQRVAALAGRRHQHDPAHASRARPARRSRVKSVGRLLGEAIKRIHHGDSISSLFM